jgi:hypothetical protein
MPFLTLLYLKALKALKAQRQKFSVDNVHENPAESDMQGFENWQQ